MCADDILAAEATGAVAAKATLTSQSWLASARRSVALLGLLAVGIMAVAADPVTAIPFSNLALIALVVAAGLGLVEVVATWCTRQSTPDKIVTATRSWPTTIIAVACGGAVAAQSWFHSGTVIAGGDNAPPSGIAWISRLFLPWSWSGWNLGGPSALEQKLPWAAVLGSIHLAGGSAELAQRIWYTALFVGTAVGILALLLTLGLRPVASAVGAIAYVFSPYVVANVMPNPVYMAALALLPALPAAIMAAANGVIRVRTAAVLLAASAPLMGYVYQTPPLLGMVLVAVLCTPAFAGFVSGRAAARRAALVLALGLPIAGAISAYWVVPSMFELASVSKNQLATISSWSWTEGRANLLNAFWLNTTWGWKFPEYYPFAGNYDGFPLSILKFGAALLAFAALAVGSHATGKRYTFSSRHLRLAVVAASSVFALILLSTGTNPPGNVVFDRLYSLPYGWLLREPGRFLMVADMMYAILIAITLDAVSRVRWQLRRIPVTPPRRFQALVPLVVALALILPGFPLVTGAIVPDKRPILPSSHVQLPNYWKEMGAYVDSISLAGAVLVLPPDDFYQMPYSWGYYGNDEFIRDLMSRPVLTPSGQAYVPPTQELVTAIDLTAKGILDSNWKLVDRLLRVLGAPLLLVRGDLDIGLAAFYQRTFPSPFALASALEHSPNLDLIHSSGPLMLFALHGFSAADSGVAPYVATVDSPTPDLRILPLLPDNAALVAGPPSIGTAVVQEPPPLGDWRLDANTLNWDLVQSPEWSFALVQLEPQLNPKSTGDLITITHGHNPSSSDGVEVSLPVQEDLQNGNFQEGLWAAVGSCAGVAGANSRSATIASNGGPSSGPFLRLAARQGSACESQSLQWHGGPLLVKLNVRNISGALPHICLWETGPQRCAVLPAIPDVSGWSTFAATTTPDAGTTAVGLYLYADVYVPGVLTENDYADVRVLEVPSLPQFDFVGTPLVPAQSDPVLVQNSAYSPNWRGPRGSRPVLIDGLLNGWRLPPGEPFAARYSPADEIQVAFWVTALGLAATLLLAFSLIRWRRLALALRKSG